MNTNKKIEQILKQFEKKLKMLNFITEIILKNYQVQTTFGD